MPKLAIYIPKHELRQIETWRRRINFSQVFMKALKEEIRAHEALDAKAARDDRSEQFARAVAHYRRLRDEGQSGWRNRGRQAGARAVLECTLDPSQIAECIQLQSEEVWQRPQMQRIKQLVIHGEELPADADEMQAFCEGFVNGVSETWWRIEQEIAPDDNR